MTFPNRVLCLISILSISFSCDQRSQPSQAGDEITFRDASAEKRVDILVDGELFTSYRWPDGVFKPVLYPIVSAGGSMITRGFPLETRGGERYDHRHQVGSWLNYGNVNGYDFWGNGHTGEKLPHGGVIVHKTIDRKLEGNGEATLVTTAEWQDPAGAELLAETTSWHFFSRGNVRIIDRITTLTATNGTVTFNDTKEGMFAIRVARELELPSDDEVALTDASGNTTGAKIVSKEDVTGNYRSSEGVSGEAVWGTRAKWMNLYGRVGEEGISIVICDHPKNPSYPTWWHARGYGLFSANPLGAKDFTKGEQEMNFSLAAGDAVTFRYRIIVTSGSTPSDDEINRLSNEFSQQY